MGTRSEKSPAALGFLAVCDLEGRGLVGGYLLLNAAGRPLEFHCTAPVRPSRAQEILYGPTLEPFLYGEQIGRALVEKSAAKPLAVFTDREAVLAARPFVAAPLALVLKDSAASAATDSAKSENPLFPPPFHRFEYGANVLTLATAHAHDAPAIVERLAMHGVAFDLAEPFERIREAVREAHRDASARSAQPAAVAVNPPTAEAA
ncbi:MAG: hypothetical protein DCC68_04890 [Planctomycetota bacterium]|nr:MAG: hypothetical protein DCC68_04890 [Planctomycetota bacterium]